jgi:cytoskeleton-associated protein 5
LIHLVDPDFQKADGFSGLSRALNVLMVRIIENANPNYAFKAFLKILSETALTNSQPLVSNVKYLELAMKCLWKITKVVGSLISSRKLVVEDLLFDIHSFLLVAPPEYWKNKATISKNDQADMPLRTIRTILHEVVNSLGVESMSYASVLPNIQDNHVVNYLRQMVMNFEKKNINNRPNSKPNTPVESTEVSESARFSQKLDHIFALISDKELTKNGIQQLHEFQKQNPGAFILIENRLLQTGNYFQGYIRRGLANLAQNELLVAPKVRYDASPSKAVDGDAEKYKETLAKLQKMFVGKDSKQVFLF